MLCVVGWPGMLDRRWSQMVHRQLSVLVLHIYAVPRFNSGFGGCFVSGKGHLQQENALALAHLLLRLSTFTNSTELPHR